MMRTIVCLTTALAFALHIGLGCCFHHAHAADGNTCQHPPEADQDSLELATSGHTHSHADHDHQHADESPASPTPDSCPHEECKSGKCVFVSISKVDLSQLANISLPAILVHESLEVLADGASILNSDFGGPPKLPLRLHLLHQVMLI